MYYRGADAVYRAPSQDEVTVIARVVMFAVSVLVSVACGSTQGQSSPVVTIPPIVVTTTTTTPTTAVPSPTTSIAVTTTVANHGISISYRLFVSDLSDLSIGGQGSLGSPCEGRLGFQDIRPGTQVLVRDGAGVVVGASTLFDGELWEQGGYYYCQFHAYLTVPHESVYSVEVGSRGALFVQTDQVTDADGFILLDLTLGP